MKSVKQLILMYACSTPQKTLAQNYISISGDPPTLALSVAKGINIDHENLNTVNSLLNGLRFGNTTTANQVSGISSNRAGATGPYSLDFYTANLRPMIIT
jgi:hypothetical protein